MSEYMDQYKKELGQLISEASLEELAICLAWDTKFGVPGHGSIDYVQTQLNKAKVAIAALDEERLDSFHK